MGPRPPLLGIFIAAGRGVRDFFDLALEDMLAGRQSWRVLTLLSGAALAISGLYLC